MAIRRKNIPTNIFRNPTASNTLIEKASQFGNKGLKNMQGTTRVLYDSLPLPQGLNASTVFKFFKNVNTRAFPFTNLTQNKLEVGEGMVLERMSLSVLTQVVATTAISNEQTIDTFGTPGLYISNFEVKQVNNITVKSTPLSSMKPEFNKSAKHVTYNVYHFDTNVTLQPLFEFECDITIPVISIPVSAGNAFFWKCEWEGMGGILNPRTNF